MSNIKDFIGGSGAIDYVSLDDIFSRIDGYGVTEVKNSFLLNVLNTKEVYDVAFTIPSFWRFLIKHEYLNTEFFKKGEVYTRYAVSLYLGIPLTTEVYSSIEDVINDIRIVLRSAYKYDYNSYLDYESIAASSTAMNAIVASSIAMDTIVAFDIVMNVIAASDVAMNAIAASSTAMNAIVASDVAMNAIVASDVALKGICSNASATTIIASYLQSRRSSIIATLDASDLFAKTTTTFSQQSSTVKTEQADTATIIIPIQFEDAYPSDSSSGSCTRNIWYSGNTDYKIFTSTHQDIDNVVSVNAGSNTLGNEVVSMRGITHNQSVWGNDIYSRPTCDIYTVK